MADAAAAHVDVAVLKPATACNCRTLSAGLAERAQALVTAATPTDAAVAAVVDFCDGYVLPFLTDRCSSSSATTTTILCADDVEDVMSVAVAVFGCSASPPAVLTCAARILLLVSSHAPEDPPAQPMVEDCLLPKVTFVIASTRDMQLLHVSLRLLRQVCVTWPDVVEPDACTRIAAALSSAAGEEDLVVHLPCVWEITRLVRMLPFLEFAVTACSPPLHQSLAVLLSRMYQPVYVLSVVSALHHLHDAFGVDLAAALTANDTVNGCTGALLAALQPFSEQWHHGDPPPANAASDAVTPVGVLPAFGLLLAMLSTEQAAAWRVATTALDRLGMLLRAARHWRAPPCPDRPLTTVARVSGQCVRRLLAVTEAAAATSGGSSRGDMPALLRQLRWVCT